MNCHLEFFVHRVDSIEAEDPGGDCWNQGQTFACLAQRHTFLGGDTLQCSAKSVALRCTLCACTAFQQCVLVLLVCLFVLLCNSVCALWGTLRDGPFLVPFLTRATDDGISYCDSITTSIPSSSSSSSSHLSFAFSGNLVSISVINHCPHINATDTNFVINFRTHVLVSLTFDILAITRK